MNDFSGAKSFRDFQEMGPWPQLFKESILALHWINLYPLDNSVGFGSTYPMDSDLSTG